MERIGAVINRKAGNLPPEEMAKRLDVVRRRLEERVSPGYLAIVDPDKVEPEIDRMVSASIHLLIVGGGDGTVSTAARHLAGTDILLAVLCMGTRNHFAGDLSIPADPEEALALLDHDKTETVDMGEMGGHLFINNVSIGLYPQIVDIREEKMRSGWRKWPAHMLAALKVLWWLPQMRLLVRDSDENNNDDRTGARFRSFLFVGNNEYESRTITDAGRASLKDGRLWYCMPKASGLWSLFRLGFQLRGGGIDQADQLETHKTEALTVYTGRKRMRVAIDGETFRVKTPLQFQIRKKHLKVRVP